MFILLVLSIPLLNYGVLSIVGRKLGYVGTKVVSIFNIFVGVIILMILGIEVSEGSIKVKVIEWIECVNFSGNWELELNGLVFGLIVAVIFISTVVHIYSLEYMGNDPIIIKFISLLGLFTGSILLLVISNSVVELFVGWELIGVASYLLIGFWSNRLSASNASIQAFITNRIGDWILSIMLYIIYNKYSTLDISIINNINYSNYDNSNYDSSYYDSCNGFNSIMAIFIMFAAIGKSAQLGLHIWLPSSMEGPTPVSALIHAATLVCAGVFLCLRLSPILEEINNIILWIGLLGSLTALIAGLTGMVQNDLKRVIAYSTMAQIGYIFISIGIIEYSIAISHILNHAFFKAILFLSAGVLIHGLYDLQDIRRYGGLLNNIPITYLAFIIGSLSLMAIPYFTGYYSKDLILELSLNQYYVSSSIVYTIGLLGALLTAYYSVRLLLIIFTNNSFNNIFNNTNINNINNININYNNIYWVHEGGLFLILPIFVLLPFSLILGYYMKDCISGLGSLSDSYSVIVSSELFTLLPINNLLYKYIGLIMTIIGLIIYVFLSNSSHIYIPIKIFKLFIYKFYLDIIVNKVFVYIALHLGLVFSKFIDRGWFEPYYLFISWFKVN